MQTHMCKHMSVPLNIHYLCHQGIENFVAHRLCHTVFPTECLSHVVVASYQNSSYSYMQEDIFLMVFHCSSYFNSPLALRKLK